MVPQALNHVAGTYDLSDTDYDPNDMDFSKTDTPLRLEPFGPFALITSPLSSDSDKREPECAEISTESHDVFVPKDTIPQLPRLGKRSRLVFDGVHVPPLNAVYKRRRLAGAEDKHYSALPSAIDSREKDAKLARQSIRNRLKPIGLEIQEQYFTNDPSARQFTVTRQFMADTYGGHINSTYPIISEKFLAKHGMKKFLYMRRSLCQIYAPKVAGGPGLWLTTSPYKKKEGLRTMVKVDHIIPNWQYVGQYESKPASPPFWSEQEWAAQTTKFQDNWVNMILTNTTGKCACARIVGRRELKRNATSDELDMILESEFYKSVTSEEVRAAYRSGEEKVWVSTLRCIGYDNAFQLQLHQKYMSWLQRRIERSNTKLQESVDQIINELCPSVVSKRTEDREYTSARLLRS